MGKTHPDPAAQRQGKLRKKKKPVHADVRGAAFNQNATFEAHLDAQWNRAAHLSAFFPVT
jgi:hypothetical protein